jgi:hypothetical protein
MIATHALPSAQMTAGRIGVHGSYNNAHIQWDDFIVRMHVKPEPQVIPLELQTVCP